MGRDELINILKQEMGEETQIDEESEDFLKTNINEWVNIILCIM